ncbi:MAG: hypothetical protein M1831_001988 [Alyxoria varia]|nr:MAG: hypothetical protein M1831_001988 [Alyxoria varia]
MTLTVLGDAALSLTLTIFADRLGRKNILMLGSLLMIASGMVFVFCKSYWLLLLAAILGVISPSGYEIGPFRAIEESIIAQLTPKDQRSDMFAWYTLIGIFGGALGNVVCGWIVQTIESEGNKSLEAYQAIWRIYSALGAVKLFLAALLSKCVELDEGLEVRPASDDGENGRPERGEATLDPTRPFLGHHDDEQSQLLNPSRFGSPTTSHSDGSQAASQAEETPATMFERIWACLPQLSSKSRGIVLKLSMLFSVDSFGSGLVPIPWIAFFFTNKFSIPAGPLGTLFFVTCLIAAVSNLVSASIVRRIGLVKTMVFTHLPSSIFLGLIPVPNNKWLAMALLALRSSTASMDTAPRQAFTAAAVLPEERTAVMGTTNVIRTLAQSAGPLVTGKLAEDEMMWVSFVLAGLLKSGYDLGMLAIFSGFHERG